MEVRREKEREREREGWREFYWRSRQHLVNIV